MERWSFAFYVEQTQSFRMKKVCKENKTASTTSTSAAEVRTAIAPTNNDREAILDRFVTYRALMNGVYVTTVLVAFMRVFNITLLGLFLLVLFLFVVLCMFSYIMKGAFPIGVHITKQSSTEKKEAEQDDVDGEWFFDSEDEQEEENEEGEDMMHERRQKEEEKENEAEVIIDQNGVKQKQENLKNYHSHRQHHSQIEKKQSNDKHDYLTTAILEAYGCTKTSKRNLAVGYY